MALRLVCDVTDESGDDVRTVTVIVDDPAEGRVTWKIDVSDGGKKIMQDTFAPVVERGTLGGVSRSAGLTSPADDPDDELDPAEEPTLPKPAPLPPPTTAAGGVPSLNDAERAAARAWGQIRANYTACGRKKPVAANGSVPVPVQIGWVRAGRPMG